MKSPLALHEGAQMITILVYVSWFYVSYTHVPRNLMKKIVQIVCNRDYGIILLHNRGYFLKNTYLDVLKRL